MLRKGNMEEDSRILRTVPNGSEEGGLKRLKFKAREVSATRDFPVSLCRFGKNLEPDTGLGSDFCEDNNNVELLVNQESIMPNVFADDKEGFVAHDETSEHENADPIDSMRLKNRTTMNAEVNMHKAAPKFKRRKVSAVRDFPVALRQCSALHALQKKEIVSFDVVKNDYENDQGPADIGFVPLSNRAETELYLVHHDLNLDGTGKVVKVGSVGGAPEWEEKAEYIVPLAIQEHDAEEKSKLEIDRAGESFYIKLEIPEPVKQDIVQDKANLQIKHKSVPMKMYPAFKIRKVSAVRDFPVAFKFVNKGSSTYTRIKEEKHDWGDSPLAKEPVNPKISVKQEKVECFQEKQLGSKEPDDIVIVQALMAAPMCPWKQGKVKRFQVQHLGSKAPDHRKRGKVENSHEQHLGSKSPDHRKRGKVQNSHEKYLGSTDPDHRKQGKVESSQKQHLGSKDPDHIVIVQALMAAPMCPWSSKKPQGSNKRKCI